MPKQAPKTDRGHIAFLRRTKSGAVSQIQEKAKTPKPKTKSGPRFSQGDEVYFRRPGPEGDQKTKRGHIKAKTRTGWTIIGRPDGKVSAESAREVFVPDEHVLSKKQYEKRQAAKGTRTATSTSKREVSVTESNRRAAVAAKRFPLSEGDVITHPKFQDMMSATVTSLATKNGIRRQGTDTRGGVRFSPDNLEYNDLVSDYITAAANAMRRELAASPKADLDAFAAQLRGEESGSRIFATITTEGRGAVMRHLKERAARFKDTEEYQENPDDPGVRRRQAGTATHDDEYNDEHDDGMFQFDFDEGDRPHLWSQDQVYDPTGADPYEQMRYREAVIEHFVSKLPAHEREVIERKYAIGAHLEPQTNAAIAETLKQRQIAYPEPGRDWNRQSVTPVHDSAITRLRTLDGSATLKEEYQRNVKPRLKKSLTAADFFRALREHVQMLKSGTRPIAHGITLRTIQGRAVVSFDPKAIVAASGGAFAKSYSSDLSAKNPGGRWITVKQGPLSGRHIFILPHKDGTATVLSGGGPAMRHKLLQPKKEEPAEKKPEAEGSKPSADKPAEKKEISEERRSEIESSRQQHRSAIKEERGKMAEIVREHLGKEIELTEKDRAAIEKKVEGIADPRQKATERMRETFAVKKERDQALQEILQAAKQIVVEENPTATEGEKQPSVAAVVKAHAEDLLQHHYRIEALKREDRELGKLLKTNNEKRPVGDTVTFEPLSKDDLKKVIVDEELRDKEMAAHYKLAATVRGYVDSKGTEHQAKGGAAVERNLRQGGYEAVTGIIGELTGNSIMTRATYDEIGPRGAAAIANYYLQNSGVSAKKITGRLAEDLGKIGGEVAERAVRKGDEFMAMAEKVKQTGYGAESLMEAAQARGAALKYVNKAYETYAQAQGALNQAAELAYEAANTDAGKLELAAASASTLDAKRRRLGLKAGDVKVEKDGDGYKMTVKPTAFEKLLHEQASAKTGGIAGEGFSAEDIKAHRANTDDFHPQGINEYTPPNKEGVSNKIVINPSQQAAVRFIAAQKRVYLNYEAGTGKSLSVIAAKAHLEEQSGQKKKMIVSMPSPIMKNFAAEVAKFSDYKVAVIEPSDTPEQRRAKYNSGPDTIVVVNHEKMNFDQKDIQSAGFHMVVADEAHTVTQREGSGKSQKSEGLQKVARQAEHYVAMSGTPTPADLSQLYFHANLMNPEKFSSQKEFMARFGAAHKGEGLKEKISAFMNKDLGEHVITAKKGTMLKPDGKPVELRMKTHFAPLSDSQRKAYRETVAAVKNGEISQLQAENRMKGTLNDAHHADNGKFDHIKKLIDHHMATKGPTEKVSLYVNSYAGADNIHEFLEKHYPDAGVVRFANKDRKKLGEKEGRNYTAKEKGGFVETFKHDPTVRFGIHTMAGTTGLNVQHDGNGGGATTVIAVSSGEASYSTIDQFFSRGYRTGANRDIDAHMVLTDTPYDLGTKLRLDEKKAVGEMLRSMPEGLHLLRKAHVREYQRRTKSGAVSTVHEHNDNRRKKPENPGKPHGQKPEITTITDPKKLTPGMTLFHGTRGTAAIGKGKQLYLTADPYEAQAYAQGKIPGTVRGAKGDAVVRSFVVASHMQGLDINEEVMEALMEGDDIDETVNEGIRAAKAKGYGYVTFYHPSASDNHKSADDFAVIVPVHPEEWGKNEDSTYDAKTMLRKSHIKAHQRRSQGGTVSMVKEHEDRRTKALAHRGPATAAQVQEVRINIATFRDTAHGLTKKTHVKTNGRSSVKTAGDESHQAAEKIHQMANEIEDHWYAALNPGEFSEKDMAKVDELRMPRLATEAKTMAKQEKPTGAWVIEARRQDAMRRFMDSAMEQFQLTKDEAKAALAYYIKHRLVKIDATSGQFNVKHGAFWEKEPIKTAATLGGKLVKAHIKTHTRTTASGAVTQVREHDDKRQKKAPARKKGKEKRLADQLDAGIKDGSINKRIFLRERKALRESLKDTKKQLKTAGPRKHKQLSADHAAIAEKLGHYNEAYGKNEFLSPKQKAQLQWFQDKQKKVMPDNDHLLQAIAKLGGIRADAAKSQWGLSNREYPALTSTGIWGKPVLRQTGGWDPDKMAEMLAGNGFVKTNGGKHDYRDFEQKLLRAAAGEKIMGDGHITSESDAQAEENAYYENLRQSELGQAIEDAERPDYDAIGYKDCSQEEQEAFDAVYQTFMTTVTTKATRTFYDASVPF